MTDVLHDTLLEAYYEGIHFPVSDAPTDGGNDSVEHVVYGVRGADIEPTGQMPYSGSLEIPLVNDIQGFGVLYPDVYNSLIDKFQSTPLGQLTHPTHGVFTALIKSWQVRPSPEVRNGLFLSVRWIEHNAQAGTLLSDQGSTPSDSPVTATARAAAADAAMASVAATGFTPMGPMVSSQLAFLESATRTPNEINSSLSTMIDSVSANIGLPAFSGTTAHAAVAALESLRASILALRDRYQPDFNRFRQYTTPRIMSLLEIAQLIYGDASKAHLISAINTINDPLMIRAGTTLTILPDTAA